ncbi:hypothetical protein [Wenjunlia tyrosinilytica]|uniref:Uncharacterized protein n=1 Tax=Wenjunlia tyrosinilytica TaxID=1544741 RepID=A0A918E247_9ACTN|nr:hypothetical protein [Wenjunlia tyrosinilytica]GGO98379.1 hypothetical protein GCM10012280_62410 [Wenjunlia tyrosinilytica]
MADDPRDDNRNGNVVSFRSRGGAPPGLPPIPGAPPPAPPAPPAEPPAPASGPEVGVGDGMVVPARRRRSVADSLADLTPTLPPAPGSTGTVGAVALRSEGTAPARGDGDEGEADGPGVAALGLAATLAIALAALRGTATVLTDWRQRRQERAEELAPLREARLKHRLAGEETAAKHALAMQSIGDKAAQKRGKSIPSSQEYGRKALGGGRGSLMGGGGKGSGPGGKGTGGAGPGRGGKGGSGSGLTPGGKKTSPKTSNGLGSLGTKGKGGSKSPGSGKNGPSGKNGGSGSGIKSPSGGKSPSSKKSSPALERARGRQERAAARQGAKVQRRADRQAARAENRAKDRDAARDRKTRAADARQDTKDRVRNARADAKQARKEQVRQDRFEAKQKARKARAKARRKKKETAAASDATFGRAVAKAARRRLKKRRKNLAPPVLTTVKRKKPKKGGASGGATPAGPKVDLTKKPKPGATPKVDLTKKPKPAGGSATGTGPKVGTTKKPKPGGGTKASGPGRKKKVRVKPKSKKKTRGSAPGTGPADRRKASRKERARRASERAKAKTEGADSAGSGWEFYTPPPRGERRSAYDSMRDTDPQQQEVWTVGQIFPPGYQASSREPLTTGARGLPAGSTTTNTKEAPVGNSPAVNTGAVTIAMDGGMNPEHATEVTLDDVTEFLDEVVSEAFAAHDECLQLARKARELMHELDWVAAQLAAKHNIIGTLTAWAMRKLAESMEVLSRKAEEMSIKSLHAAETCETAKTEMDDAYRPLTQATADAGLRTPSARVHNEN